MLITNFAIYRKDVDVSARTTTPYRPIIHLTASSLSAMNNSSSWDEINTSYRIDYEANLCLQVALCGTSLYTPRSGLMRTNNRFDLDYYCAQIDTTFDEINQTSLLPSAYFSKGFLNLDNARSMISPLPSSDPSYYAMILDNCPLNENLAPHIALNVIKNNTYQSPNVIGYEYNGMKLATLVNLPTSQYAGTVLAFESLNDIISYFNDWGLKATNDLDVAMYSPYGSIANAKPIPSPSGGESGDLDPTVSVNVNVPITNIPNLPSNKIDDFAVTSPNISPINLMNNYILNISNVKALFNWLCSTDYIHNQSELFADKLSAIYGLIQYPFDLVNHDLLHTQQNSQLTIVSVVGNVPNYALLNGYNTIVEGGTLNYVSYFGNFNDWENCTYSVYVPYGGIVEVDASYVVNRTLRLQYCVDLTTGKATAVLKSYENSDKLGALVKTVPCQIGISVPVQSSTYGDQAINNTLTSISMISSGMSAAASLVTGNIIPTVNWIGQSIGNSMFNHRTQYNASGTLSPSTGLALPQTPYLCITRCRPVEASNFTSYNGRPTNYYCNIGSLASGSNMTQIQNAFISSNIATEEEINQIQQLLENGVYL